MKNKAKAKEKPNPLWVEILDAKPNEMWSPEMTKWIRFLRYSRKIPCAACGKKRNVLWTMLVEFKAVDLNNSQLVAQDYPQSFPPLTPVCGHHPLHPNVAEE